MGWNSQNITQLLIVNASGGFTGLFVYSPAPGTGNLITSVAATSGTDPYGNPYQGGGPFSYSTVISQSVGLSGNSIGWQAPGGVFGTEAQINFSTGSSDLIVSRAAGFYLSGMNLLSDNQNPHGQVETWHAMSGFGAGWAAGSPAPRYQFECMNGGRVRLAGQISSTAAEPANSAIFTLPVGYRPANAQLFLTPSSTGTIPAGSVLITTGGVIQQATATTGAGQGIVFDGITFPLD